MLKRASIWVLIAILVLSLGFVHIFFISAGASGSLFWNRDTAIAFIDAGSLGYSMNYLEYIGENFWELVDGTLMCGDLVTLTRWEWAGDRFVTVSPQDVGALPKAQSDPGPDYDNINGWSKRCCFLGGYGSTYTFSLNGTPLSLITKREDIDRLSVDLVKPDGERQTIWVLDGRTHTVSKGTYDRVFGKK